MDRLGVIDELVEGEGVSEEDVLAELDCDGVTVGVTDGEGVRVSDTDGEAAIVCEILVVGGRLPETDVEGVFVGGSLGARDALDVDVQVCVATIVTLCDGVGDASTNVDTDAVASRLILTLGDVLLISVALVSEEAMLLADIAIEGSRDGNTLSLCEAGELVLEEV